MIDSAILTALFTLFCNIVLVYLHLSWNDFNKMQVGCMTIDFRCKKSFPTTSPVVYQLLPSLSWHIHHTESDLKVTAKCLALITFNHSCGPDDCGPLPLLAATELLSSWTTGFLPNTLHDVEDDSDFHLKSLDLIYIQIFCFGFPSAHQLLQCQWIARADRVCIVFRRLRLTLCYLEYFLIFRYTWCK